MSIRTYTTHEYHINTDAGDFELSAMPYDSDAVVVEVVGNTAIVGYLALDDDCPNPLEDCDGMGHIYSAHRNSSTHAEMQEALGLNGEWEPNLSNVQDQAEIDVVKEGFAALNEVYGSGQVLEVAYFGNDYREDYGRRVDIWDVTVKDGDDETVFSGLEYYDYRGTVWTHIVELHGHEVPIRAWDDRALELWREGRKNGTIGNKYAVSLDVYEHSGIAYHVSGEGMQCMWDTARGGAVWVPDECLIEDIESYPEGEARNERVVELARQACEEYTSWCNGDCYGVIVEKFVQNGVDDLDEPVWEQVEEIENCWGFIGYQYAMKEMEAEVKRAKEALNG